MHQIARFEYQGRDCHERFFTPGNGDHTDLSWYRQFPHAVSFQIGRYLDSCQNNFAFAKAEDWVQIGMCKQLYDTLSAPMDQRYGLQAKAVVNFCPAGVVKARHHTGDLENITGDAG